MEADGKIDLHDVVLVPIKSLKKDPTNPNVMNERQMNGLRASMKRFGYLTPIIVDKSTMLIADGEHRLTVYEETGRTEVPCILLDLKDDAERRLLRQTMNKLRGMHDEKKDANEIEFLVRASKYSELALLTGLDGSNLLRKLRGDFTKEQNLEPVEVDESIVKRGQIWQLDKHRLMCGDGRHSLSAEQIAVPAYIQTPKEGIAYANDRIKGLELIVKEARKQVENSTTAREAIIALGTASRCEGHIVKWMEILQNYIRMDYQTGGLQTDASRGISKYSERQRRKQRFK